MVSNAEATVLPFSISFNVGAMVSALLSPLLLLSFQRAVASISVHLPTVPPSGATAVSPTLLAFSIEQDAWTDWSGTTTRNEYFYNLLNNLKTLSGEATRLRIGADSEDHTNFSPHVKVRNLVLLDIALS